MSLLTAEYWTCACTANSPPVYCTSLLSQLEDLNIGVRVGSLSHGDNFVKVLVALLTAPRARPIRRLDLSDTGLSDVGVAAVASLVVCSDGLKELRVSRNYMSRALVVSSLAGRLMHV